MFSGEVDRWRLDIALLEKTAMGMIMVIVMCMRRGIHTNRCHTLAIIIQILEYHLTNRIHLPSTTFLPLSSFQLSLLTTQQPPTPLQLSKHTRQLPNHALKRRKVPPLIQHNRNIEDILVSVIPTRIDDADGVADDAVAVGADGDEAVAEFLGRNQVG